MSWPHGIQCPRIYRRTPTLHTWNGPASSSLSTPGNFAKAAQITSQFLGRQRPRISPGFPGGYISLTSIMYDLGDRICFLPVPPPCPISRNAPIHLHRQHPPYTHSHCFITSRHPEACVGLITSSGGRTTRATPTLRPHILPPTTISGNLTIPASFGSGIPASIVWNLLSL